MSDHFRKLERMYHAVPVNELYSPVLEISEGKTVLTMNVNKRFFHAANALHGSVYFKALDDAAFFAVNSLVEEYFVLTVSFNIYLLRPVSKGVLRAEGKVTARTSNLFTAESVLFVDNNRLVAHGSGSFMRSRVRLEDIEYYH
jgi:uncharacterized protein (TIGR00369 family)